MRIEWKDSVVVAVVVVVVEVVMEVAEEDMEEDMEVDMEEVMEWEDMAVAVADMAEEGMHMANIDL